MFPEFAVEVKSPLLVPINVLDVLLVLLSVKVLDTIEALEVPSKNVISGAVMVVKLTIAFPIDSSQFKIPSLSISMSRLSMTKSLSRSSGHSLTGMTTDSNVFPVQAKNPLS